MTFVLARIAEDPELNPSEREARASLVRNGHEEPVDYDELLTMLAARYEDHPEFDPSWRP